MQRRTFIKSTAMSAAVLPNIDFDYKPQTNMGVVVHSYAMRFGSNSKSEKYPAFSDALALLKHCASIGTAGVQTIVRNWAPDFSNKVRNTREQLGMYLEGSIALPKKPEELPQFEADVKAAKEAGASILRSVSLGGRRYEVFKDKTSYDSYYKNAQLVLEWVEPILKKHQMKLGVENHKDWRATELASTLKQLSSEYLGVTLDFGNSIALLEDPLQVVQTLAPYVLSAHIKDMAVAEYPDGFLLSEVPMGQGILDLPAMVAICRKHNPNLKYSLEMITRPPLQIPCFKDEYWVTFDNVQARELAKTIAMVKAKKTATPLPTLEGLSTDAKLELEEENILKSVTYSQKLL
jgi:3-oxoisoapionate decarboxylase